MNLKKILTVDFGQVWRALVVDSRPVPVSSYSSYGHQIDAIIDSELSVLTNDAIGYKIEDNGVFVGCYLVDYSGGVPSLANLRIRKVYSAQDVQVITQQVNSWMTKEYQLV